MLSATLLRLPCGCGSLLGGRHRLYDAASMHKLASASIRLLRSAALSGLLLAVAFGGFWWGAEQRFPYNHLKRWQKSQAQALPVRATIQQAFARKSDVVMVGDSLTAGVEWQEVFPHLVVANRGIGGDTTADILRRIDTIRATEAKRAFVMAGINDVVEGVSVEKVLDNYRQIIDKLKAHGMEVVVQSTIECAESRCGARRLSEVRELNKQLRAYAETNGLAFIDLNDGIVTDAGLSPAATVDGIHLNADGYRHWKRKLAPVM